MSGTAGALRELQCALHDHVLGHPSTIAGEIRDDGRIATARRLQIYHDGYRARLREALKDTFATTWSYLGDDLFAETVDAFVVAAPPQHRNIRWYGEHFMPWLAQHHAGDPEISELAMIDWELRCAFDGADAAPVPAAVLQALRPADWESLGCRFAPTLRLVRIGYNTPAIWHALDRDEVPPSAAPLDDPEWLLIWRKGWQPHFRTLPSIEAEALTRLQLGTTMPALCTESLLPGGSSLSFDVLAAWLRQWIADEIIVQLTGLPEHRASALWR